MYRERETDVKVAKLRVNEKISDSHFNNHTVVQNKDGSHVCLLQVPWSHILIVIITLHYHIIINEGSYFSLINDSAL